MTVADLIKKLQAMPQDARVAFPHEVWDNQRNLAGEVKIEDASLFQTGAVMVGQEGGQPLTLATIDF
jgi:hypothetical protein